MSTSTTTRHEPGAEACCEEFRGASRRGFLKGALVAGGTATVSAAYGTAVTQTAYAATGTAPQVMVVLSMRGAADGLNLVVPHADPVYWRARPSIAVPRDRLLVANGMFGLHPRLAPLLPLWNTGKMAAVHATGLASPNRSHFSAMEEVEDADPGSDARVGWLNRLVGRNGTGSPVEAIQFGGGGVPSAALAGPQPVLATRDVDSVKLAGADGNQAAARRAALGKAWAGAPGDLGAGFTSLLDVVDDFADVRTSSATPGGGATYPQYSDLGAALAATARTIRADVGAEVITVDHGSWDHHTWIGAPDNGFLQRMIDEFAGCVAAFFTDLGPLADKVTVITISEFGRRVVENANQGLDHGHGNVMFALGAGVKGGYYGRWPGLTQTTDADLLVTTDYRSVLNEVVTKRLGSSTAQVFPGLQPETLGFMTTA